jgi:hypothetical protein
MPFRTLTKTVEISILHKISAFEEELRRRLEIGVPLARREFDTTKGFSAVLNRVFDWARDEADFRNANDFPG